MAQMARPLPFRQGGALSPRMRVRRATVIGAGVMGAGIAAQFANAGVPVRLLDMPSAEVSDDDRRAGRGAGDPDIRNRLARAGRERVRRATPSGFMAPDLVALVTPCNVEDDLHCVRESDWVIETVVENLAAKHEDYLHDLEREAFLGLLGEAKTRDRIRHMLSTGSPSALRGRIWGSGHVHRRRHGRRRRVRTSVDTAPAQREEE